MASLQNNMSISLSRGLESTDTDKQDLEMHRVKHKHSIQKVHGVDTSFQATKLLGNFSSRASSQGQAKKTESIRAAVVISKECIKVVEGGTCDFYSGTFLSLNVPYLKVRTFWKCGNFH